MENKNDRLSVSVLLSDFFGHTSMHGAERIINSREWIRKVLWIILMLGALGVSSWQIHQLYSLYQKRPLATHIDIERDSDLTFPAITVCDMNSLRLDPVKDWESTAAKALRREMKGTDWLNSEPEEEHNEDDEDGEKSKPEEEDDEEEDAKFIRIEKLMTKIAKTNIHHDLAELGHQFEDFMIYCSFRGINCVNHTRRYWNRFWHYAYGNCYIFNGGYNDQGERTILFNSSETGPFFGLSLELNIEQGQYIGSLTQEAGVRIDISDQGEMPFPLEKGLSLAPGYATSIGMRKVVIKRSDPFWNNSCMNDSPPDSINLYRDTMEVGYSTTACKKTCWARKQQEKCGCVEYKFPRPNSTRFCETSNKTDKACVRRVIDYFSRGHLDCSRSCPPPCKESTFKLTTSYSLWPTNSSQLSYQKKLKATSKEVDGGPSDFRHNILKVNVFFEELNYEVISEDPAYELPSFMSDLGGSLGLWIGMSVLTFAEILELILLICYSLARKLKKGMDTRSTSVAVEKFQPE
ncbi:amiloride-sensitive sodium channel subunit alpha-like isoform X3 [Stylophora pistillata]|uniref:amiloride-sensitive sodium channel subunit alpha-like isoform X3 n=1 Tax=Stylophora pistillata TaxID=50429 RepID=UPI000C043555|nr:amiloride-sensitive sodium channel subunit alpha-like isoform X3 [Stylophora pistillata]